MDGTSRGQWGGCGVRRVGKWTGQVKVSGLWCQTGRQVDRTSRGEWGGCGVRRVGKWTGQVEVSAAAVVSDGSAGGRDK